IADLDQKIKEKPTARLFAQRAVVFNENRMYAEALADIDFALRLQPKSALYHGKRAFILNNLNRFTEAVREANVVLRYAKNGDEDFIDALAARAFAYHKLGKSNEANRDLEQVKKLDPSLRNVH